MPLAVYLLGLAVFALGTSEFMLAGLLPAMAADLHVSIPTAGLLISAFAVGMVVGAPTLALATLRVPRRLALTAFLAVFVVAHVVGASVSVFGALLGTRMVAALAAAGFTGVATVTAMSLVPASKRGRATAIVVGGLTVANVVGVPAGTALGQHAGWRAAFWAVAVLAAVAAVGVFLALPKQHSTATTASRAVHEMRALGNPRLWATYATIALASGSVIVTFGYLGTLLERTTHLSADAVPLILGLFGVGALIGITIGGRVADSRPRATVLVGGAGLVVASILLALTAAHPVAVTVLVFMLGLFGFVVTPSLNVRAYALAGAAPTLAGGTTVAAYNVGNTAAPWLGGTAINAGFAYASVAWIGAALGIGAIVIMALSSRERPTTDPAATPAPVATELV
ncbi:Cmx/CmrA family chloramphenicol efflux MFS transporter [Spirillospora sp. NPDC052269]